MVSDDLGFLLIFIVLPTVLIVSGFWLVLFIRRDSTLRSSVQRQFVVERDRVLAADFGDEAVEVQPATADPEFPIVIATLPIEPQPESVAAEPKEALPGADAISINLLHDTNDELPVETVPDARLFELVDPQDRDVLAYKLEVDEADEATDATTFHHTEQLDAIEPQESGPTFGPNVAELQELQVDDHADETEQSLEQEEAKVSESDAAGVSGSTAPLPEHLVPADGDPLETSHGESNKGEEPEGEQFRRRRQPDARLVKSTDNVMRRGRASARKVPPLGKPVLRDEDPVEGDDRS